MDGAVVTMGTVGVGVGSGMEVRVFMTDGEGTTVGTADETVGLGCGEEVAIGVGVTYTGDAVGVGLKVTLDRVTVGTIEGVGSTTINDLVMVIVGLGCRVVVSFTIVGLGVVIDGNGVGIGVPIRLACRLTRLSLSGLSLVTRQPITSCFSLLAMEPSFDAVSKTVTTGNLSTLLVLLQPIFQLRAIPGYFSRFTLPGPATISDPSSRLLLPAGSNRKTSIPSLECLDISDTTSWRSLGSILSQLASSMMVASMAASSSSQLPLPEAGVSLSGVAEVVNTRLSGRTEMEKMSVTSAVAVELKDLPAAVTCM